MSGVLDGIRVLDFGRYIAGPYCATLLGDMGAEVIRVERVDGSEDRFIGPVNEAGDGALFMQVGRNKLGLTLNPLKPEGRELVKKLVATADVVVANLPDATLEQMGLDYDSLRAIKDDIILTTASAFGSQGPFREKLGFDGIGQAMSGNMHLTGYADEPMKNYSPYVDFETATLCAFGTMAAILEHKNSGRGQHVQGSLLASALTVSNAQMIEQSAIEVDRVGSGNRGQLGAPSDAYQTKDGWVLVQSVGPVMFKRWADLIGEDHWLDDPRFADDLLRGNNSEVISARFAEWAAERTTEEMLSALEDARIPAGQVLSPREALVHPQVTGGGYLKDVAFPGMARPAPIADTPVRLSVTPGGIRHRAPPLGEHTDQILTDLGYAADRIADLRAKRVV
ncbi:MAG: CoA transferase [Rhodospirillales bacterium]|nr:CoA transferase [Rhodospirillales bacterium]